MEIIADNKAYGSGTINGKTYDNQMYTTLSSVILSVQNITD